MENTFQEFVKGVSRRKGAAPNERACLEITDVGKRCPAQSAGIETGDLILTVDGRPAAAMTQSALRDSGADRVWTFFSRATNEQIQLRMSCINPGVAFRPTNAAIVANPKLALEDPQRLLWLWESRDHEALSQLLGIESKRGFFGKLLSSLPKPHNSPVYLLHGVALYEQGDKKNGLFVIQTFAENFVQNWTSNYHGLIKYYLACEGIERGNKNGAAQLFDAAFQQYPCSRIADSVAETSGARPERSTPWMNRLFPVKYDLPRVNGKGSASLEECLVQGRLLIVCLLANYRGNGPYNDFMEDYMASARALGPNRLRLHVVTMESQRDANRPHWFAAEDRALRESISFDVLKEDGSISTQIRQRGSPHLLFVSPDGKIIHEHEEFTAPDLWNALFRIEAI